MPRTGSLAPRPQTAPATDGGPGLVTTLRILTCDSICADQGNEDILVLLKGNITMNLQ